MQYQIATKPWMAAIRTPPAWFPGTARTMISTGRTADPAVHSAEPHAETQRTSDGSSESTQKSIDSQNKSVDEKEVSSTHWQAPPKLIHAEITPPMEPSLQQKRSCHGRAALEEVSCEGVDGTFNGTLPGEQLQQEQEDDFAYLRDHKPSPLAEIEFEDKRFFPLTRATDKIWSSSYEVVGWLEEQLDTAEEALLRARRLFLEAAERGDPDSPQSRALRAALAARSHSGMGDGTCYN